MNGLALYLNYIGVSIRSQLQYPASFIMTTLGFFLVTIVEFLGIWVLFERFGMIRGWELPEIAVFYGIIHVAFALAEGFGRGFDTLHRLVRSGDFDRFLLRPRRLPLQIMGQEVQLLRIGRIAQGLLVMGWGIRNLQLNLGLMEYTLLMAAICGGVFLFMGLFVIQATITFWSVESVELANMVTHGGVETAQFPMEIYGPWLRRFFTFIFPVASINYFPLLGILAKETTIHPLIPWISPLIGVLFYIFSLEIFKFGVKNYKSTGS